MAKLDIIGTITEIEKNTYKSGKCMTKVMLKTESFDGSNYKFAVKFFNSDRPNEKLLADLVFNECKVGDWIRIKTYVKPWECVNNKHNICKVVQFIAEDFIKMPITNSSS